MKKKFNFYFDDPRFKRKYSFDINFPNISKYEAALDWAEKTEDISNFIQTMNKKYGYHEVIYNPDVEFFGFETYDVLPVYFISVMTLWREFFQLHGLDCSDIEEVSLDKRLSL